MAWFDVIKVIKRHQGRPRGTRKHSHTMQILPITFSSPHQLLFNAHDLRSPMQTGSGEDVGNYKVDEARTVAELTRP